jgi:DNA-binding MarR family transcriptional regulator
MRVGITSLWALSAQEKDMQIEKWKTPKGKPTERLILITLTMFPDVTFRELWELVGGSGGAMDISIAALLKRGAIERTPNGAKRPAYLYRVAGGGL